MQQNYARRLTGNARLLDLRSGANELHQCYYGRKRHFDAAIIGRDIESVAELLAALIAAYALPEVVGE